MPTSRKFDFPVMFVLFVVVVAGAVWCCSGCTMHVHLMGTYGKDMQKNDSGIVITMPKENTDDETVE